MKIVNIITITLILVITACDDFLDVKPNKSLVVPGTLEEFRALLDNDRLMNITPGAAFISADNYYIYDTEWQSLYTTTEKYGYIWAEDIYRNESGYDWEQLYEQVFVANVVLDGLEGIEGPINVEEKARLRASAYVYRAHAFLNLLQLFAPPYDLHDVGVGQGIPLRLTSDINAEVKRDNVHACYQQVLIDLQEAREELSEKPFLQTRPAKAAADALLARTYLYMGAYEEAEQSATSVLEGPVTLLNYKDVDSTLVRPFSYYNKEVIFHSNINTFELIYNRAKVSDSLYQLYNNQDLRKALFFEPQEDGSLRFTGDYTSSAYYRFGGIATDEIYLIRAECRARLGDLAGAAEDLNTLLSHRWKEGTYSFQTFASQQEALDIILKERRKELLFRGLRWADLRRLNREEHYAKTLVRSVNGRKYQLPPNDPKYVYPIPDEEINASGITQNRR